MLTERHESKSFRVNVANEKGNEVLSSNVNYSKRNISISFDMIEPAYCVEHKEEVQSAITAFIARLNAALADEGLPIIVSK